jgi:hypothetical protein
MTAHVDYARSLKLGVELDAVLEVSVRRNSDRGGRRCLGPADTVKDQLLSLSVRASSIEVLSQQLLFCVVRHRLRHTIFRQPLETAASVPYDFRDFRTWYPTTAEPGGLLDPCLLGGAIVMLPAQLLTRFPNRSSDLGLRTPRKDRQDGPSAGRDRVDDAAAGSGRTSSGEGGGGTPHFLKNGSASFAATTVTSSFLVVE